MQFFFGFLLTLVLFVGCNEKIHSENQNVTVAPQKEKITMQTIAGMSWYLDIDRAFVVAQKEHKEVIIMVGEESCRWCKKMKERTLTNAEVQEKMNDYILVSIKRSDKASLKYVPQFDGNIPSFFFMHANKELIEPVVGYFKAEDFLSYIEEIEE